MTEVSKEAVEALGKSINRSTTYLLDSEEIMDVCDGLAKYGYTIAPIAQPVSEFEVSSGCVFNDLKTCPPDGRCVNANPASDEKLREAADNLEGYEFICEGGNLRNCADWHDIKAELAELAERRAAEPAPLPNIIWDRKEPPTEHDVTNSLRVVDKQLHPIFGKTIRAHIAALTAELATYRCNDKNGVYSNRTDKETD